MTAAGPAFYARVYHPAFNVDMDDSQVAANDFEVHTRAVSKSVQALRNIFGRVREARLGRLHSPLFNIVSCHNYQS